ncbi:MAG TPA: hypothetical protein VKU41_20270, partial [Polyangiaceae bacterium]|nr:hypothetical protein [Polyangiaceae bacterium]
MLRGRRSDGCCSRRVRAAVRLPFMCVVFATSSVAGAQENTGTVAEALFRSGRSLMAQGDLPAACAKFAESHRIDPKLGTLMNLALCHEKSGRTASAWAEYLQAGSLAERAGQSDRARVAREHAAGLEPKLLHVVIDADAKSDAAVTLDDQPIGPAAYRTALPVDPGDHVLRATAPGKAPWELSIHVAQGDADPTLKVPALETSTTSGSFASATPGARETPPSRAADSEALPR